MNNFYNYLGEADNISLYPRTLKWIFSRKILTVYLPLSWKHLLLKFISNINLVLLSMNDVATKPSLSNLSTSMPTLLKIIVSENVKNASPRGNGLPQKMNKYFCGLASIVTKRYHSRCLRGSEKFQWPHNLDGWAFRKMCNVCLRLTFKVGEVNNTWNFTLITYTLDELFIKVIWELYIIILNVFILQKWK